MQITKDGKNVVLGLLRKDNDLATEAVQLEYAEPAFLEFHALVGTPGPPGPKFLRADSFRAETTGIRLSGLDSWVLALY